MARLRAVALPVALLLPVAACGILGPEIDEEGTVRFLDLEGGCWVLQTEDETFEPLNLPEDFMVDGLPVHFEAEPRPDLVSFCARTVELESIERIS